MAESSWQTTKTRSATLDANTTQVIPLEPNYRPEGSLERGKTQSLCFMSEGGCFVEAIRRRPLFDGAYLDEER